ncbi:hypothetical protein [Neorhizobium galegae]|uniref:Uncharacterized protein n=1 Tax=Neorhizobium galegae bv. orientalis str. HAMBI 540 TaxID=1028800 RepID=A0A068SZH5_NEOGA|nr:hypothetical protein [Neorhizobium galegae]CDN51211.1 Hypothetical protein RG540_PA05340 [Neorhizobium galegae bv. orientalis str. HAMBI 540]
MANDDERHDSHGGDSGEGRGDRHRRAMDAREAQRKAKAAAKLRENLMRRKTQARARRAGEEDLTQGLPAAEPGLPAAKTDESS